MSEPIANPQAYPVQWPLMTLFIAPVYSLIVKTSPNLVATNKLPLYKSNDLAYPSILNYFKISPFLLILISESLAPDDKSFPDAYANPITAPS